MMNLHWVWGVISARTIVSKLSKPFEVIHGYALAFGLT
jgi:hypothetical protein